MRISPIAGYSYVYSIPLSLNRSGINSTSVVVSTTDGGLHTGMTVIVDYANFDFRSIVVEGVLLRIVPNDAILCVVE